MQRSGQCQPCWTGANDQYICVCGHWNVASFNMHSICFRKISRGRAGRRSKPCHPTIRIRFQECFDGSRAFGSQFLSGEMAHAGKRQRLMIGISVLPTIQFARLEGRILETPENLEGFVSETVPFFPQRRQPFALTNDRLWKDPGTLARLRRRKWLDVVAV